MHIKQTDIISAFKTYLFTCFFLFMLTACGFQPLYGVYGGVDSKLIKSIEVDSIPSRIGQNLRNILLDELSHVPNENPPYRLKVEQPSRSAVGVGIDRTSESETRVQLLMKSNFWLIDNESNLVVFNSSARGFVAYNVLDSQFESITARENAQERALNLIAQDIVEQVSLYFHKGPKSK